MLFDFSLAGTPDTEVSVGTRDYLDPFLGHRPPPRPLRPGRRAVRGGGHAARDGQRRAAVLGRRHGRARLPRPRRGGRSSPRTCSTRCSATAWWSSSGTALHRDAAKRFGSLQRDDPRLDGHLPRPGDDPAAHHLSDRGRRHDEAAEPGAEGDRTERAEAARVKRAEAIAAATASTPLAAAGLSPYALSIAQQQLGVSTAGELARVPARRITRLRGIGSVPRYELVRRSREWRQRFDCPRLAGSRQEDPLISRD